MHEKKQITILYVEDDDIIRESIGKALKRLYENVVLCENGELGLKAFDEIKPDIVVSDIEMPVMNGKEMITQIKAKSSVPCIMLTAYNDPSYLVPAADKTLFKPVALYDIVSAIDGYL